MPELREALAEAVKAIPPPVTRDDVMPELREALDEAVKAIPVPKNGTSVTKDEVMPDLLDAVREAVKAIPVPQDGKSVTVDDIKPVLEAMQASWALDFERRAQAVIQHAIDTAPKPKDGKSFDGKLSLQIQDFGDGRIVKRWFIGEEEVGHHEERTFIDRGVFREDGEYWRNNAVSFGGSLWIAQKDHPEGKPDASDDWRLAVKHGRDLRSRS